VCWVAQAAPQQASPPAQHVPPQPACGPAGQRHVPVEQVAFVGQATPHPPQFWGSVLVALQRPEQQVSASAQAVPHVPQCASVVSRSKHPDGLHSVSPGRHVQAPPTQRVIPERVHAVPQPPQCAGSVSVFTHVLPQAVGSDVGHRHVPSTQTSFVSGQAWPHAATVVPQFAGSVSQFVQRAPPPQSFGRGA